MAKVTEGAPAPDFELESAEGPIRLSDFKGKTLVLYFYPKDDTTGCTQEGKDFSALAPEFAKAGVSVVGVSKDSVKSHQKFAEKYGLTFPLASDESHAVAEKYGTWVEKSMYGRKYMGMERSTFLIGADGKVKKVWRKVSVTGHAADVMKAAQAL